MNSKLSHILALSGEAALFIEQGRIVYCNAGAERLLGPCLGRQAAELLGAEYSASHARAFVLSMPLQGAPYLLRVNRLEEGRLHITFREEQLPGTARMFGRDWLGYFRDWNQRTGSRLVRTIVVRKPR